MPCICLSVCVCASQITLNFMRMQCREIQSFIAKSTKNAILWIEMVRSVLFCSAFFLVLLKPHQLLLPCHLVSLHGKLARAKKQFLMRNSLTFATNEIRNAYIQYASGKLNECFLLNHFIKICSTASKCCPQRVLL